MKSNLKPSSREFKWISSVNGDPEILSSLDKQMTWFYGQEDGREMYQLMVDSVEEIPMTMVNYG